jgi:hypothetical protein
LSARDTTTTTTEEHPMITISALAELLDVTEETIKTLISSDPDGDMWDRETETITDVGQEVITAEITAEERGTQMAAALDDVAEAREVLDKARGDTLDAERDFYRAIRTAVALGHPRYRVAAPEYAGLTPQRVGQICAT